VYTFNRQQYEAMSDWPAHQRFWLQHWAESLHFRTAPEYRVRPITLAALFHEFTEHLSLLQARSSSHEAVEHLREEVVSALRSSDETAALFPNERRELLQRLGSAVAKPDTSEFETTLALARSFFGVLDDPYYVDGIAGMLFHELSAEQASCDKVALLTDLLISEGLLAGFSEMHLYNGMWPVLDQGQQLTWGDSPLDRIRRLLTQERQRVDGRHEVVFLLRSPQVGAALRSLGGIEITRQIPAQWIPPSDEEGEPHPFVPALRDAGTFYAVLHDLLAKDRFSAVALARSMLQDALDSLRLAAPGIAALADERALLWHGGLGVSRGAIYGPEHNRLGLLSTDLRGVQILERRVARIREECSAAVATRLLDAMHWYKLGLEAATTSMESALLCFWICLETLFRSRAERSVVMALRRFASPIYCLYYPRKLARDLSAYFYRLQDVAFPAGLTRKVPSGQRGWRVREKDLLSNLRDHAIEAGILDALPLDELLRHRMGEVISMFADGKSLAGALQSYNHVIGWDIARAYRLRNSFVHAGSRGALDPAVAYTCRIAFEVARRCLESLVFRCSHTTGCEIEDVFVGYETTYRQVVRRLQTGEMAPIDTIELDLLFMVPRERPEEEEEDQL